MARVNNAIKVYEQHLNAIKGNGAVNAHAAQVRGLGREWGQTTGFVDNYSKAIGRSIKNNTAFIAGLSGFFAFDSQMRSGIKDAIEFGDTMVRVGQTLGRTRSGVAGIEQQIRELSVTLGISSKELSNTSLVLAQAGYAAASQTKELLGALAKAALAPSFTDLNNAIEGVVAATEQFHIPAERMERTLGMINHVSKKYAVEANDIISAIRKTGSVFREASADADDYEKTMAQFIATFTAIRSTTRESADTIGTGMRTIITRLQRPQTVGFFQQMGVDLTDVQGNFVGVYEALDRMGKKFATMNKLSPEFARAIEEMGG